MVELLKEWKENFENNFTYEINGNVGYLKFRDGKKFTFKTEKGMKKAFKNAWYYAVYNLVFFNQYITFRELTGKALN